MRDYAQGAFRMRGIGKGQTVTLYLIPEVRKLIDAETRDARPANLIAAVAAWLTINSARSERLQFMQLCTQNLKNVWRTRAFEAMLADATVPLRMADGAGAGGGAPADEDSLVDRERRYWRFSEVHTEGMLHVRRCINTFREPIDLDVAADITEARTFATVLREELAKNQDLIEGDAAAAKAVQHIQQLASGSVALSTELQARALNQEMVNEQEQEQEQKKTVRSNTQQMQPTLLSRSPICSGSRPSTPTVPVRTCLSQP